MPAIVEMIGALVRGRDEVLRIEHAGKRQEEAAGVIQDGLFILRKILGDEILLEFLGNINENDPTEILAAVRMRMWTLGSLFVKLPQDKASPFEVAREAHAVYEGDAPILFAQLPGIRKRPSRLTRAKLGAICWDAYLEKLGIDSVIRHSEIAKAYANEWGTIQKWDKQALDLFGTTYHNYMIMSAKAAGNSRVAYNDFMEAGGTWQEALERDGAEFRVVQRVNRKNT